MSIKTSEVSSSGDLPGRQAGYTTGEAESATARVAGLIKDQILSGALRPGDRLPTEKGLTTAFQVSRNSAREALRELAGQGFVTMRRGAGGGTFVAHPSPTQISGSLQVGIALLADKSRLTVSALLEVREMLEVPAAELAALRRSEAELEAIEATLFDLDHSEPTEIFTRNRNFHFRVLAATHNPLLPVVTEPIFEVLKHRLLREQAPEGFWETVDHDHRAILACMAERDQAGAREATRAHLRNLRATYEAIDRNGVSST